MNYMPNSHTHVGKMLLHQLLVASIAYIIHKIRTFPPFTDNYISSSSLSKAFIAQVGSGLTGGHKKILLKHSEVFRMHSYVKLLDL